ncbi:MFS transporter [Pseudophaeobacter sp.]|uniref:MFS transporter n=1 Tax=Pseudophaeobacter sp. TaxID=1971739 RepID=UPI003297894F
MQAGLIMLCLAYVLSQFFRAFLGVLTSVLGQDIGASPSDLADASGMWFLSFAAMQLPVGWALDKIGPRRTAAWLLFLGGTGGASVFALATSPFHVSMAMFFIGIGCSPVLMASYYIFARQYPVARFATLAALMLGMGSVGNLVASYPTAFAVEHLGWRATLWGLALASWLVAAGIFLTVQDPPKPEGEQKGSVLDLLKMPVLWAIFPLMFVCYAPSGALRGLWIGPYLSDVYGLDTSDIGLAALVMGVAMVAGTFAYGPLDRIIGSRKWVIFTGNALGVVAMLALIGVTGAPVWMPIAVMALVGFLGGSFPVIIAHGRAFVPPHLVGRGVTLLNFFGIGGVGIMQFASGTLHSNLAGAEPSAPYLAIFGFFAVALAAGCVVYLFSRDSME